MTRFAGWSWLALLLALGCGKKAKDLTVEQLTTVVAGHQEALKPCYQAALDKHPDSPEFRMQATLHVAKDGSVQTVELERGPLPTVSSCIEKVVRTWKFPEAEADTYASLPIIFRPTVEPIFEAPRNPFENANDAK
ncbi:MAG TPA: AgmX/PglI C-terminal domain-containing protein [Polyangiales bacterium]|nr:AgmX/PglI C-terminal domain-containing protein [Polyangiales bacterium]